MTSLISTSVPGTTQGRGVGVVKAVALPAVDASSHSPDYDDDVEQRRVRTQTGHLIRVNDPKHDVALRLATTSAEELLLAEGDDRSEPVNGRNSYGFRAFDFEPVARLSSSTCTPVDLRKLSAARSWRRESLDRLLRGDVASGVDLRDGVIAGILGLCGLCRDWADRTILAPSGTHAQSVPGIILAAAGRPVVTILVGAREMGRGSVAAAQGRWFSAKTPFGVTVNPGQPLSGLEADLIRVVEVAIRDEAGSPRREAQVVSELRAHVSAAVRAGARALVYSIESSKTGLTYIAPSVVHMLLTRYPEAEVVVDAAQLRIGRRRIHAFLRAGASIVISGSKALTGPPFCGALILNRRVAMEAARAAQLPSLGDFVTAADLPPCMVHHALQPTSVNLGLLSRWQVALAEKEDLERVPPERRAETARELVGQLRARLLNMGHTVILTPPGSAMVMFALNYRNHGLSLGLAREVASTVAEEFHVYLGQPVELVPGGSGCLRAAVGADTISRLVLEGVRPRRSARNREQHSSSDSPESHPMTLHRIAVSRPAQSCGLS